MKIWILIQALLAFGFIGYLGCVAFEINKWMRKRHLRLAMRPEFFSRTYDVSADEIKHIMHAYKTSTLPTGEVEVLGPGTMEEMADEVIKEARE